MAATAVNEDDLCAIFAERILTDAGFVAWLLGQTKFSEFAVSANLLAEEQMERPAKAWWRHWWCEVKETGRQSETDIMLVFASKTSRFALHIENKLSAHLAKYQADDYAPRARQLMANKWAPYDDFETVIIAPLAYISKNMNECRKFDHLISYEAVSEHIPEYLIAGHAGAVGESVNPAFLRREDGQ